MCWSHLMEDYYRNLLSTCYLVGSKNSCGLSVIEFQEAAEALASLYIP